MNAIAGYRFIDILPLFSAKYRCARAVKKYRIIAKAADCKSAPKTWKTLYGVFVRYEKPNRYETLNLPSLSKNQYTYF